MWRTILGSGLAVALVVHFVLGLRREVLKRRHAPVAFFAQARSVIDGARLEPTGMLGYPEMLGTYRGLPVRVRPVVDTLSVRKLPSLWLLVTIPDPLPVAATFDMMMRPAGPSTFSNFERLPVAIDGPPGFPLHAVVRTDDPGRMVPPGVILPHLRLFDHPAAKELLVNPSGLRIVWLMGEAERARYGIFRQAEFGEVFLSPDLLKDILDELGALRASILAWKDDDPR